LVVASKPPSVSRPVSAPFPWRSSARTPFAPFHRVEDCSRGMQSGSMHFGFLLDCGRGEPASWCLRLVICCGDDVAPCWIESNNTVSGTSHTDRGGENRSVPSCPASDEIPTGGCCGVRSSSKSGGNECAAP
jgi:hypothetical protein